jgi:excisionase family DNA binding protein
VQEEFVLENRLALSVREAAQATGYSREAVQRAILDRKLVASRPGGKGDYRILLDDLKEWLRGTGRDRVDRPSPNRASKTA